MNETHWYQRAYWKALGWWCRTHLPGVQVIVAGGDGTKDGPSRDKSLVYGKVLCDDYPPYVSGWLRTRPRGVAIVPAQPWNVGVEELAPDRVFRFEYSPAGPYDGSQEQRLDRILAAVAKRKPGESIDIREIR